MSRDLAFLLEPLSSWEKRGHGHVLLKFRAEKKNEGDDAASLVHEDLQVFLVLLSAPNAL